MRTSDSATRILDSAQRLIQQRGVKAMSYADISTEVGVGKPTIHHHYATKANLVEAVAERYFKVYEQALGQIEASSDSPEEQLRAYARLFQNSYADDQNMCLCGMLAADIALLSEQAADTVARFSELNVDFLSRLISRHRDQSKATEPSHIEALASLIFSSLEGALLMARGSRDPQVLDRVSENILRLLG